MSQLNITATFPTAFNFFTKENYEKVKDMAEGASTIEINHILANLWRGLPETERKRYQEQATAQRQKTGLVRRQRSKKKTAKKAVATNGESQQLLLPKLSTRYSAGPPAGFQTAGCQTWQNAIRDFDDEARPSSKETKLVIKETKTDDKLLKTVLSVLIHSLELCETCKEKNSDFIAAIEKMKQNHLLLPKGNTPRLNRCKSFPFLRKRREKRGRYALKKKRKIKPLAAKEEGNTNTPDNSMLDAHNGTQNDLEICQEEIICVTPNQVSDPTKISMTCRHASGENKNQTRDQVKSFTLISPTHDTLRMLLQDLDLDAMQLSISSPTYLNEDIMKSDNSPSENTTVTTRPLNYLKGNRTVQNPDIQSHPVDDCFEIFNDYFKKLECNETSLTSMSPNSVGPASRCDSFLNALNNYTHNNETILSQLEKQLQQFEKDMSFPKDEIQSVKSINGCEGPRASTPIDKDLNDCDLDNSYDFLHETGSAKEFKASDMHNYDKYSYLRRDSQATETIKINQKQPKKRKMSQISPEVNIEFLQSDNQEARITKEANKFGDLFEAITGPSSWVDNPLRSNIHRIPYSAAKVTDCSTKQMDPLIGANSDMPSFILNRNQHQEADNVARSIVMDEGWVSPRSEQNEDSMFTNTADMLRLFKDLPDISISFCKTKQQVQLQAERQAVRSQNGNVGDCITLKEQYAVNALVESVNKDIAELYDDLGVPSPPGHCDTKGKSIHGHDTMDVQIFTKTSHEPMDVEMQSCTINSSTTSALAFSSNLNSSDYFPASELSSDDGLGQSLSGVPPSRASKKTVDSLLEYSASAESNADVSTGDNPESTERTLRKRKKSLNEHGMLTETVRYPKTMNNKDVNTYRSRGKAFPSIDQSNNGSYLNYSASAESNGDISRPDSELSINELSAHGEFSNNNDLSKNEVSVLSELSKHELSVLLEDSYYKGEGIGEDPNTSELEDWFEELLTETQN